MIAPIAAPELKMPCASARSRGGNHVAFAFTAPGQLPASLVPSVTRSTASIPSERTAACKAIDSDHTAIDTTKPSRVPITSRMRPNSDCPTA